MPKTVQSPEYFGTDQEVIDSYVKLGRKLGILDDSDKYIETEKWRRTGSWQWTRDDGWFVSCLLGNLTCEPRYRCRLSNIDGTKKYLYETTYRQDILSQADEWIEFERKAAVTEKFIHSTEKLCTENWKPVNESDWEHRGGFILKLHSRFLDTLRYRLEDSRGDIIGVIGVYKREAYPHLFNWANEVIERYQTSGENERSGYNGWTWNNQQEAWQKPNWAVRTFNNFVGRPVGELVSMHVNTNTLWRKLFKQDARFQEVLDWADRVISALES